MVALMVAGVAQAANPEPFDITIKLYTPITIVEDQALQFGNYYTGSAQTPTIAPADGGAAQFTVSGSSGESVTCSIGNITDMTNGTDTITLGTFTYGGDLASNGIGTLSSGTLAARIGATATIEADDTDGAYTGSAEMTVVYTGVTFP